MDTAAGTGLRHNAGVVGFGSAGLADASANQINLNTADFHAAFSMPAKGTVTAMTALLSATEGGLADVDSVVSAQLYQSTAPDTNIFEPIPDAVIKFEPINGVPTSGTIRRGMLANLNIPADAGIRLLMVFYLETPGHTAGGTAMTGFLSGSIMIK